MFDKFLENRNEKIQAAAAELLNLMGMPSEDITAYEEAQVIDEAESILKANNGLVCYPYYGGEDGDTPCYKCGDCERQKANKCYFLLQTQYVFTFGNAEHFPYSFNEFVLVNADNEKEAVEKFRSEYPDAHEGLVNCAFWYRADEYFANGAHKDMVCRTVL